MQIRKREKGQALVEFALVIPILLLLIFGTIELGRVFHAYHVITSSAREGARAAAVHKTNAEIELKVEGAVSSLVSNSTNVTLKNNNDYDSGNPGEGQVFITIDEYNFSNRTGEGSVVVKVKSAIKLIAPIISSFFPRNPVILESQAEMRLE